MSTNRIREVREAAGLTLQQLADRIAEQTGEAVTRTQLSRLELGKRRLTVSWMNKIARALECEPIMLLNQAAVTAARNEVVPKTATDPAVAFALKARNITLYEIEFSQMDLLGLHVGDTVSVDVTPDVTPPPLAVVLARIAGNLTLRQWIPTNRLVTATTGAGNSVVSMDDAAAGVEILGVVLLDTSRS